MSEVNSHVRKSALTVVYRNLKWTFEDSLHGYCYATEQQQKNALASFVKFWVGRRRSGHEWTASSPLHLGPAFSRLGPIASNRAPRQRGARATPTNLRKRTLSIEAAYVVPARGPQYFKRFGLMASENQSELRDFNTLIHHNSFWNRNSGHCLSILSGLIFWIAAS